MREAECGVSLSYKRGGDAYVYNKFLLSNYLHIIYLRYSTNCNRSCLIRSIKCCNKKTRQNKKHISAWSLEMYY